MAAGARARPAAPWVNTTRAIELINREDALVLDVRDAGEYGAGHILGAKHLPLARIDEGARRAREEEGAAADRLLTTAASARRRPPRRCKRQGFTQVANLSGGLDAWRQAGLPVEK